MGTTTGIEWCDHTFNYMRGCEKVSAGCDLAGFEIVAADESPGTPISIEQWQLGSTATSAVDQGVVFAGVSKSALATSVFNGVIMARGFDFQIFGAVIALIAVAMVNLLAALKGAPDHLFGDQSMLIHIAPAVRLGMTGALDQPIPVGCARATAFPIRVSVTRMYDAHAFRITHAASLVNGR